MGIQENGLERKAKILEGKDFIPVLGVINLINREKNLTANKYSLGAGIIFLYNTSLLLGLWYTAAQLAR